MPLIDKMLDMAREVGASDLHISVDAPPMIRVNAILKKGKLRPLTADETKRIIYEVLDPGEIKEFEEKWELDMCYTHPELGRFRTNVCKQRKGVDATMRLIPEKPSTLAQLGFPPVVRKLLDYRQGMILVTGQAGCGKSTTLAAMVNYLNDSRKDHVITLEDPIELLHKSRACHINQREIGRHTESFHRALRAALREDPDIILVGEMRDLETISMAITAAETGHLVLATLHTTNTARTISRILDVFPPHQQGQIRAMVSESLRGIICQRLLPTLDGDKRVVALEIMIVTPAISNLIREDRTHLIPSQMQVGATEGMILMDDSILSLVASKVLSPEVAFEQMNDKSKLRELQEKQSEQICWDDFMALDTDKKKLRLAQKKGCIAKDKAAGGLKPIPQNEIVFSFYVKQGRMPVGDIVRELERLCGDAA